MLKLEKKRIPIGYEDFKDIIDNDFYYVDKTMLIYEAMLRSHRMRHGLPRCVFTLRQPRVFIYAACI
ncbi:MAG TPA: AAA family ATPase [Candidatus Ornithomonoglobus merdipullorum]|uniref:AAA family ATPase n=1 Tax=Candidatus Ornithomonoglobus merdipullorum TaxID=2840895 RepID=A0A9D1SFA3_9FIRM|nr:AAA family ATPase [Candidatus Ornithomonoglobus merdipullorum]